MNDETRETHARFAAHIQTGVPMSAAPEAGVPVVGWVPVALPEQVSIMSPGERERAGWAWTYNHGWIKPDPAIYTPEILAHGSPILPEEAGPGCMRLETSGNLAGQWLTHDICMDGPHPDDWWGKGYAWLRPHAAKAAPVASESGCIGGVPAHDYEPAIPLDPAPALVEDTLPGRLAAAEQFMEAMAARPEFSGQPVDVDEDGAVQGRYMVETYFRPAESWSVDHGEDFLRLVIDDGATNIEVRLTLVQLEEMVAALRPDAPALVEPHPPTRHCDCAECGDALSEAPALVEEREAPAGLPDYTDTVLIREAVRAGFDLARTAPDPRKRIEELEAHLAALADIMANCSTSVRTAGEVLARESKEIRAALSKLEGRKG